MLSGISIGDAFMYYCKKMSLASEGFVPRPPPGLNPWTPLGTCVFQTPLLPTPGKILGETMTIGCVFEQENVFSALTVTTKIVARNGGKIHAPGRE